MSFPFPKTEVETERDPEVERAQRMGGEFAAHAIIQSFRGPMDWHRFYKDHGGPAAYAAKCFGWSEPACIGFVSFFLEIQRKKGAAYQGRLN